MKCKKVKHSDHCNCTYEGCSRKFLCCKCINYHRIKRQLPACVFPNKIESNYDRSFENFADLINKNLI